MISSARTLRDRTDSSYILAIGFGTSVAMWGLGFFLRMLGGWFPSAVLLVLLLVVQCAGGFVAGRATGLGWRAGGWVGALSSTINLLVLGSLLGDSPQSSISQAAIWVTGSIALGWGLSALGGWLGARSAPAPAPASGDAGVPAEGAARRGPSVWTAHFAWVAVGATFLLLMVGGLVTSKNAGLAVVDWPNSYGYNMFLFPMSRMTGGVYYEHAHRLIGALVGLTTLTLAIHLFRVERRPSVRGLGLVALGMVIGQGIMGGLRVTGRFTASTSAAETAPNLTLALVHGVFGQIFFATMITLAVFCSRDWDSASAPVPHEKARTEHRLSALLVVVLILQLVLGAILRHTAGGLHLHLTMAVLVILLALVVGMRASAGPVDIARLRRLGKSLVHLIGLQLVLGIGALLALVFAQGAAAPPAYEVALVTAHQVTGALLLGCSVLLALWTRRLLAAT